MFRGQMAAALPSVSVVVPVYNDAERLARCLAALERQTYPRERVEVIVVDNGSTDDSAEVPARYAGVRLLREASPSSYAARNRGVAAATGEVLAFTDADCVPDPRWLDEGVAMVRHAPNCGLVAGAIEFFFRSPGRPTLFEIYDAVFDFDQKRAVELGRFACTANLFTPAAVLRAVGLFDATLKSVGDREWGNRVAAAGYTLGFARAAIVRHPARSELRDVLHKRLRVAGGHHDVQRRHSRPMLTFVKALVRYLIMSPVRGARRVRQKVPTLRPGVRMVLLGLHVALCCAEAAERTRLQAGGVSRR